MSDELPEGPFFDAIREWNEMVRENRAKFPDLPEGLIPVGADFMRALEAEIKRLQP